VRLRSRIKPRPWPIIMRNMLIVTASSAIGRATDEQAVSKISLIHRAFETLRPTSDHASATNASRPSEVMLTGVGKRSINAKTSPTGYCQHGRARENRVPGGSGSGARSHDRMLPTARRPLSRGPRSRSLFDLRAISLKPDVPDQTAVGSRMNSRG